jgi:phosphoglycerate dehydrogenase-like enzyme
VTTGGTGGRAARRLIVEVSAQARNWAMPPEGLERIAASAPPGWEVQLLDESIPFASEAGHVVTEAALSAAPGIEAYFGWGIAEPVFARAPGLRWVHSCSAGVGRSLFPAMLASDVVFTNSAGVMGESIAEHAVGGALHFLRGFDVAGEQQRAARWDKAPFTGGAARVRELCECRVVVVGTGGRGEAIGRRFQALGAARVIGVRRRLHLAPPAAFDEVIPLTQLDRVLPEADVVVLAAPLTPETRLLLSGERLDCLPPGAIVVNVARGALLDEEALADRLAARQIRGAVLDVFAEEPLRRESRLWRLGNVLITPHVSYVSPRLFWRRALDLFLDNWSRYSRGEPLRNVVDKEAGY